MNIDLLMYFGFKSFIEYPLIFENRIVGTIGFYNKNTSSEKFDDTFLSVFNLFGLSLSNLFKKQNLDLFSILDGLEDEPIRTK